MQGQGKATYVEKHQLTSLLVAIWFCVCLTQFFSRCIQVALLSRATMRPFCEGHAPLFHKNGHSKNVLREHSKMSKYVPKRGPLDTVRSPLANIQKRLQKWWIPYIGVPRGAPKGPCPPNFLKYSHFVFWEAFSKQNSVIRLKSDILAQKKFLDPLNFLAGYATDPIFSGVQRGGERSDVPGHPRQGASKEWNYKNFNALTQWFPTFLGLRHPTKQKYNFRHLVANP